MSKIEKLTNEQIGKLAEYRDKWLKIGLATDRVTMEETISTIHDVQEKLLGRKKTPVVLMDDPISAWLAVCMSSVRKDVWAQVEAQVGAQVGAQVWAQVKDQVGAQVWAQVKDQVWDQVGAQVGAQVRDQVEDQVGAQVRAQVKDFVFPWLDGSLSANVFALYDYFSNCLRSDMGPKWEQFLIWQKTAELGLIWPLENICVVCQKPSEIHMRNGRLHRDGGPAVDYVGKFSVWALNGVRVPKYLAETESGQLDLEFFKKEKNAEVRAQFVRKYGVERMKELGSSVEKTEVYELIDMAKIFKSHQYAPYLFMVNPSTGTIHAEGVSPECRTIQQALNWRNQTDEIPSVLT